MKKYIVFMVLNLMASGLAIAQSRKKQQAPERKYLFSTLPMMTEAIAKPTQEAALKTALNIFMQWDAQAAASLEVNCKIMKVHDLTYKTFGLPPKLPDGTADFKSSIQVPLKFSHVTWDAEITVTKDITLEHLWYTTGQLIDFHLLSYFQQHLEKQFHDKIYQAIYRDGLKNSYVLKAGEKFKITAIHSYIAAEAKSNDWMCYVLKDDQHPGNYLEDIASLTLNKATTLDAKTIDIDYTITKAAAKEIHFEVYRSETQTEADGDNSQLIADTNLISPDQLEKGQYIGGKSLNISLLPGKDLAPDTRMHFIVVVATCNGQKSTTYFRKWLLGVVAHGFDRWAMDKILGAKNVLQSFTTPTWEMDMASTLKDKDKYDDTIAFNWMQNCAKDEHGIAESEGSNLAFNIYKRINKLNQHTGDVVDIHLIGHSRGTVVVTQALRTLKEQLFKASSPYGGGYIELTLLDPHPACNDYEQAWGNWDFDRNEANEEIDCYNIPIVANFEFTTTDYSRSNEVEDSPTKYIFTNTPPFKNVILTDFLEIWNHLQGRWLPYGGITHLGNTNYESKESKIHDMDWFCHQSRYLRELSYNTTKNFQANTHDSKVNIPLGVNKVDIFFQHTPAYKLYAHDDQEFIQNLWGMVSPIAVSCLDGTIVINKTDLTNVDIDGIGIIGHNEVPLVYEQLWVDSGTLNRSPEPTNTNTNTNLNPIH